MYECIYNKIKLGIKLSIKIFIQHKSYLKLFELIINFKYFLI